MQTKEFYNELEEYLINELTKRPAFTPEAITRIIEIYRIINLNDKVLIFLHTRQILLNFILNIIHYTKLNKRSFNSKNKILDLQLLFDFDGEIIGQQKYWKQLNTDFKKYLKTNKI